MISRNRFEEITRYLHFIDNDKLPAHGEDGFSRLQKVDPALKRRFKRAYYPHSQVSVDEAMVPFKGRSSMKQYLPMKPIKRGLGYGRCFERVSLWLQRLHWCYMRERNGIGEESTSHLVGVSEGETPPAVLRQLLYLHQSASRPRSVRRRRSFSEEGQFSDSVGTSWQLRGRTIESLWPYSTHHSAKAAERLYEDLCWVSPLDCPVQSVHGWGRITSTSSASSWTSPSQTPSFCTPMTSGVVHPWITHFRLMLAEQLIGTYMSRKCAGRTRKRPNPPSSNPTEHFPTHSTKRRCVYCRDVRVGRSLCGGCEGHPTLCMTGTNDKNDCFRLWHEQ